MAAVFRIKRTSTKIDFEVQIVGHSEDEAIWQGIEPSIVSDSLIGAGAIDGIIRG